MSHDPSILVVKPGQITAALRKELSAVGIVTIEVDDPSAVRFLRPNAELSTTDMLTAAMKANQRVGAYAAQYFGEEIAEALIAKSKTGATP